MLPDSKGPVVVLVNKSGGNLPKTSERALELLASLQDAKPRPTTPIVMDGGELARYAGVYLNGRQQVERIVSGGKLLFRRAPIEMEAVKTGEAWFSMTPPGGGATL